MRACGVDDAQVSSVADNLIWNDQAGRRNHGVERLPILMKRVRAGLIACPCELVFEPLSASTERLDGGGGFGQYVSEQALDRACALARSAGVGVVGVRNSNFFGTGAYFVQRAAAQGMISLALSNSFPKVAAHGGAQAVLGTNPMAFGAPRRDGRTLMVDMSTAAAAGSTIRENRTSADQAAAEPDPRLNAQGVLLPASGAKGFGLALMVEILSGVITMAGVSHGVSSMYQDFERSGDSGHFFLALDVARWMPLELYFARIDQLADLVVQSGEAGEVRLPGETRWKALEESAADGLELTASTRAALDILAADCGVTPPWT